MRGVTGCLPLLTHQSINDSKFSLIFPSFSFQFKKLSFEITLKFNEIIKIYELKYFNLLNKRANLLLANCIVNHLKVSSTTIKCIFNDYKLTNSIRGENMRM